jgi:[protein-PII] uridylyltransferase
MILPRVVAVITVNSVLWMPLNSVAHTDFTERECKLVAWLINNHLLMSLTAQKKDISDPDEVKEFAEKVGDMEHLDYLYTLTVADINATNPKLWNTWRASLMRQLYTYARDVIRSGLGRPVDYQMLIEDTKFAASELLVNDFSLAEVEKVWQELGDEYFVKESANEIMAYSSYFTARR